MYCIFFFFKQKTAYEILACWSSDVCSSDLAEVVQLVAHARHLHPAHDLPVGRGTGVHVHHREGVGVPVGVEDRHVGVLLRGSLHRHARRGVVGRVGLQSSHQCFLSGMFVTIASRINSSSSLTSFASADNLRGIHWDKACWLSGTRVAILFDPPGKHPPYYQSRERRGRARGGTKSPQRGGQEERLQQGHG